MKKIELATLVAAPKGLQVELNGEWVDVVYVAQHVEDNTIVFDYVTMGDLIEGYLTIEDVTFNIRYNNAQ